MELSPAATGHTAGFWFRATALLIQGSHLLPSLGYIAWETRNKIHKFPKAKHRPNSAALMAATGHLTIWGMILQVSYLSLAVASDLGLASIEPASIARHRELSFHAANAIFVLYWGMVSWDPFLIIPKEDIMAQLKRRNPAKVVAALLSLRPPEDRKLLPLWYLLHMQHTGQAAFAWGDVMARGHGCLLPGRQDVLCLAVFSALYAVWGTLRWAVLGKPAYPFQRLLAKRGKSWLGAFYVLCAAFCICMGLVGRAARRTLGVSVRCGAREPPFGVGLAGPELP